MGEIISSLFSASPIGGLLGGGKKKQQQQAPVQQARPQKTQIDPNRDAQIAAAKRKKFAQGKAAGRSSFRVDLGSNAGGAGQTRGGLTIS